MKELSIEEKAKLYDEAIERAKIKRDEYIRLDGPKSHVPQDIKFIFPVLKDIEDEKMLEMAIKAVYAPEAQSCIKSWGINPDDVVAWLKKQGEKFQYWKPSEEQLKALDYAYNSCPDTERGNYYEGVLETLIDDLHKLPEKQGEQTNPYSGISFEYNGHTWGMCARDNGVDILLNKQLFKHLEKQDEQNPTDKIIERASTEKQRVLLTETNGDAHIDWDCRSLQDVKLLLKHGLEYIDAQLEKQGELKSTNPEPKFKVGDWIVTPDNEVKHIEKVSFGNYWFTDESLYDITDVDNKGHLWTIQDAKDGDVLAYGEPYGEQLFLFKRMNTSNSFYAHCNYHFIGYDSLSTFDCSYPIDNIYPATHKQRDLLFTKIKKAGYEWDAEKKELRDIDSPTWSEEDERTVTGISMVLQSWDSYHVSSAGLPSLIPQYVSWLDSIKDRILRKK